MEQLLFLLPAVVAVVVSNYRYRVLDSPVAITSDRVD